MAAWPYRGTVYVKFQDNNQQLGPYQDDIVYDPTPPVVNQVTLSPAASAQDATQPASGDVLIQVTASDDNSGVKAVQVSDAANFAAYVEQPAPNGTASIRWHPQPSGVVYVRAVDWAGNVSQPALARRFVVYLPFLSR